MRESAHVLMILLLLPLPGALPCSCLAEQGCMDMGGFLPGAVRLSPRRGRRVYGHRPAGSTMGVGWPLTGYLPPSLLKRGTERSSGFEEARPWPTAFG